LNVKLTPGVRYAACFILAISFSSENSTVSNIVASGLKVTDVQVLSVSQRIWSSP
jgi:hypothetical protein